MNGGLHYKRFTEMFDTCVWPVKAHGPGPYGNMGTGQRSSFPYSGSLQKKSQNFLPVTSVFTAQQSLVAKVSSGGSRMCKRRGRKPHFG